MHAHAIAPPARTCVNYCVRSAHCLHINIICLFVGVHMRGIRHRHDADTYIYTGAYANAANLTLDTRECTDELGAVNCYTQIEVIHAQSNRRKAPRFVWRLIARYAQTHNNTLPNQTLSRIFCAPTNR